MSRKIKLNESWSSKQGILDKINELERQVKIIKKLYFILDLYEGLTVKEASKKHCIGYMTGKRWKDQWNEGGFEGLKRKKGSGSKSKLTEEQLKTIFELIKEGKLLTKQQIYSFIKNEYHIEYSLRQIDRIAKKKLNCGYSKPYVIFKESPKDAEKQVYEIGEDIDLNSCIFGFQDESHNNINENKMRIYYPLGTKNIRFKTRERITSSIMGFQAVNGQSVAYFPERSVTYYFLQFLLRVRIANTDDPHIVSELINIINDNYHSEESVILELKKRNQKEHLEEFIDNYVNNMKITKGKEPTSKQIERKLKSYKKIINVKNKTTIRKMRAMRLAGIINSNKELKESLKEIMPISMALDNCRIHKSSITLNVSESLNIDLKFLPKYSPQFNPIEQVWRSIKREISYHRIKTQKQLQKTIYKAYMKIVNNKSYFIKWIEKYTKHKYQI